MEHDQPPAVLGVLQTTESSQDVVPEDWESLIIDPGSHADDVQPLDAQGDETLMRKSVFVHLKFSRNPLPFHQKLWYGIETEPCRLALEAVERPWHLKCGAYLRIFSGAHSEIGAWSWRCDYDRGLRTMRHECSDIIATDA